MSLKFLQRFIHKVDTIAALKACGIILLFIWGSLFISKTIGQEKLQERVEKAGVRWPLILIFWKWFSVIFVPFSWSIIYIIAGGLYGLWKATVVGLIGNALGISISFWIGRKRWVDAISWIVGKKNVHEIKHLISHLTDVKTFTITRLVLFPLEDLINYAAGMSKISYVRFFVISIVIITAMSLLPIFFGEMLI